MNFINLNQSLPVETLKYQAMRNTIMLKILPKFSLLILLFISSIYVFNVTASNANQVIEEKNFAALAKKMKQEKKGLVLMLHAEGCPYCEALEEEVLYPMVKSGEYDKQLFVRKVRIDSGTPIIDFSGKKIDPEAISDRYDGRLTPTLLFLDSNGQEAAEKLIGYNVTLYADYVEEQIKLMRKHVLLNAQ